MNADLFGLNNSPPNTAPPECASAPTAQASLL